MHDLRMFESLAPKLGDVGIVDPFLSEEQGCQSRQQGRGEQDVAHEDQHIAETEPIEALRPYSA